MLFKLAHKVTKYLGFFERKFVAKNFKKNRPIWSHCFSVAKGTGQRKITGRGSTQYSSSHIWWFRFSSFSTYIQIPSNRVSCLITRPGTASTFRPSLGMAQAYGGQPYGQCSLLRGACMHACTEIISELNQQIKSSASSVLFIFIRNF